MTLNVHINGMPHTLVNDPMISDVLEKLNLEKSFVAVAVNKTCIPRSEWIRHALMEGDAIEILTPMSGG